MSQKKTAQIQNTQQCLNWVIMATAYLDVSFDF